MLKYPLNAGGVDSDYVTFTPLKYRSNNEGGPSAPPPDAGAQSIVLYMPNSTPGMANANNWGQVEFGGPLGEARRAVAGDFGQNMVDLMEGTGGLVEGLGDTAGNAINNLKDNFKGIGAQIAMKAASGILGTTPNQMMALKAGKVFNPNVELLYNAPQMRNFSMSFDFVPKNLNEAQIMNQIILAFKKWSAPAGRDNDAGLFEVPYVWSIKYKSGSGDNMFMNKFKKAACVNVQVQANSNTPMHVAHQNGVPIMTSMALNFMEVDIITREDHEEVGGQGF